MRTDRLRLLDAIEQIELISTFSYLAQRRQDECDLSLACSVFAP
jgi:hypothetical protein